MDLILINFLESAFTMAVLYVVYKLFLSKETFFKLNRTYLLSSLVFSIVIPFLSLNIGLFSDLYFAASPVSKLSEIKQGYNQLNAVIIYSYTKQLTGANLSDYLFYIYAIGVIISTSFFMLGFAKIILLIINSKKIKYGNYRIVENKNIYGPFSLFKWIIINPEKYSSEDIEQVIVHEKMHSFQLHTLDLIFVEVLVILFWFNPFIYWYRKSIREVHEYLADQAVVENGFDRLDYQKLLFNQVSGNRFVALTSNFSYSLSKKRLKMLTMMKSNKSSKIKLLLATPIILIALFLFANPVEFVKANNDFKTTTELIQIQDTSDVEKVETQGDVKGDGKVYFNVDVMPKFQGKESDAFRNYIAQNLVYPSEAAKNKIQGKVYIQFDVDAEGNVKNVEVVRGADPLLDAEALRVTKSSPKWEPGIEKGKPVTVRFTFPIVFALK